MRILFIDDNPDMRELVEIGLQFDGITAVVADCIAAGRAALSQAPVAAIVCDLHLERGDSATDFLRECRGHLPTVPFILLTGDLEVQSVPEAPDLMLHKPVDLSDLAAAVKALVSRGRQ